MPEIRLPLVGTFNPRGPVAAGTTVFTTGKDQLFTNCIFDVSRNPITQTANVYCSKKRWTNAAINNPDVDYLYGHEIIATEFGTSTWLFASFNTIAFVDSRIFLVVPSGSGLTNCGDITGFADHIVETIIGGVKVFLITSSDGTGWFFAQDSITTNNTTVNVSQTFTANRTSGSVTLAAVSSFAGLYVGQLLTGTGIASGARIASMNVGASTLDMTIAATSGAATGTTVTRSIVAKIIDADFPSSIIGPFACIGGYNVIMTENGRLYNSNLNSIVSWTAGEFISTNFYPDNGRGGAWVVGNRIVAFSTSSAEWFYNAGNPSGSPLSASTELNFSVGAMDSRTICRLNDEIFWLTGIVNGECSIYTLSGSTPKQISTTQVDALMASGGSVGYAFTASAFRFAGRKILLIGGYYALDLDIGIWSNWQPSPTFQAGNPIRITGVFGSGASPSTSGVFYYVNPSASTGATGLIYSAQTTGSGSNVGDLSIRTSRLDLGTGNRKTVEYYELDSDIQASGTATLEVSDDDYQTWTTIGTFDMTKIRPRIYRGGSFNGGRAHRITHSVSTTNFRASTLTIKYGVGKH